MAFPPIVIALIRAARPSHSRRLTQLAAGDDQHSKIWRGGGAQFSGYHFGRTERRFPTLAQEESGSVAPSIAAG